MSVIHPLLTLAQANMSTNPSLSSYYLSAYARQSLTEQVSACHACSLRPPDQPPTLPHLPSDPTSTTYLTLITSTPDLTRTAEAMFRAALAKHVGIAWDRIARLSLAYCGSSANPPGPDHLSACSQLYLARGLAAVRSQIILILREGGRPHPEIPWLMSTPIGSGLERDGRIYYVLHHPQTVLQVPALRPAWETDLIFVGRLVHSAFVQAAKAIYQTDSTWPYLIDKLLVDLDPEIAQDHRLSFASRVAAETSCSQQVIDRIRQSDLFGMTISEKNQQNQQQKGVTHA